MQSDTTERHRRSSHLGIRTGGTLWSVWDRLNATSCVRTDLQVVVLSLSFGLAALQWTLFLVHLRKKTIKSENKTTPQKTSAFVCACVCVHTDLLRQVLQEVLSQSQVSQVGQVTDSSWQRGQLIIGQHQFLMNKKIKSTQTRKQAHFFNAYIFVPCSTSTRRAHTLYIYT